MQDFVVPHDPAWAGLFEDEAAAIRAALGGSALAIHHIGSTSISGILAKPVIDILVEVPSLAELDRVSPAMTDFGYQAMGAFGIPGRRYFRKDDADGARTHHVHAFGAGTPHVVRHLAFRDFLRARPDVARAYSDLKGMLVAQPGMTREGYMDGKDPFIQRTESEAIAWLRDRSGAAGTRR